MREWLSGGAPPCQGGGRGFDPRLALLKTLDLSRVFLFHVAFHVASRFFLLYVPFVNGKLGNNHRETDTVSVDTVFPFIPEFTGIFFGLVNWSNNDGYILVLDENGSGLGSAQTTSGSPATLIFPFEKGKKILLGTHRNINGFYSISKVQFK